MTKQKQAIELVPGDKIVSEGTFPRSLYQGIVVAAIVVDSGVQVELAEGGMYIRPEDHIFTVTAD